MNLLKRLTKSLTRKHVSIYLRLHILYHQPVKPIHNKNKEQKLNVMNIDIKMYEIKIKCTE